LAPISGMSENAFKTVLEIDTVSRSPLVRFFFVITKYLPLLTKIFKIGTFNTIKATLSHIRASKGSYIHVSATVHYKGTYNIIIIFKNFTLFCLFCVNLLFT
jgi:2,4-dienoyl-CoA reductase [(3E)-enoyl-CoA-producing], peroxisomal